jgi:site-specific DNA recombinase
MIATSEPKIARALVRAVGYIRMSSKKQDASPEQQREEILKLADRLGYQIVRWYYDPGITGDDTRKRKEFRHMILDAEEVRDFAAILCWDQDRFGRFDSIEAGRWIAPLRDNGVWLVTVGQGTIDWNTFQGRITYGVQQEGKHQFLIDLSKNVSRGRLASARKGKLIVRPAYGYDRVFFDEAGKLVRRVAYREKFTKPEGWTVNLVPAADQIEGDTVRWIFETYESTDCSLRWLVSELNRRKVPTRRGKAWSPASVRYILTHRLYIGDYVFGRKRSGKYHQTTDEGEIGAPEPKRYRRPVIIIENHHPALVDKETFFAVQAKMAGRGDAKVKPRGSIYLLTGGLLRCGHCGRPMCSKPSGRHDGIRYYYCPGSNSGQCKCYTIRGERIEDYILEQVEKRMLAPEALKAIERAIHARAKQADGFQAATRGMRDRIAALDVKVAKGTENLLLADRADMPALSQLLGTWRDERAKLQTKVEELAATAGGKTPEDRAKRAMAELKRLQTNFRSDNPLKVRAVLKAVISECRLWWTENGERYRKIARGELAFRPFVDQMEGTDSTVSGRRRRGSGGLSRRPARPCDRGRRR